MILGSVADAFNAMLSVYAEEVTTNGVRFVPPCFLRTSR